MFKLGDEVFKARPFSDEMYCLHGGSPVECPIGLRGMIVEIIDKECDITVDFIGLGHWGVHPYEIELFDKRVSIKKMLEDL